MGGGGGGGLYTYRYTVTTRMIYALKWAAMRAILMFHNCEGQSHKTVSTDHNTSFHSYFPLVPLVPVSNRPTRLREQSLSVCLSVSKVNDSENVAVINMTKNKEAGSDYTSNTNRALGRLCVSSCVIVRFLIGACGGELSWRIDRSPCSS